MAKSIYYFKKSVFISHSNHSKPTLLTLVESESVYQHVQIRICTLALLLRRNKSAHSFTNVSLFVSPYFQVIEEITNKVYKYYFHHLIHNFINFAFTNLKRYIYIYIIYPFPKLGINKSSYSPAPGEVCRACRAIRPSKAVMLWAIKASGPLLRMEVSYFVDTFFTGKIKDSRAATVKKAT